MQQLTNINLIDIAYVQRVILDDQGLATNAWLESVFDCSKLESFWTYCTLHHAYKSLFSEIQQQLTLGKIVLLKYEIKSPTFIERILDAEDGYVDRFNSVTTTKNNYLSLDEVDKARDLSVYGSLDLPIDESISGFSDLSIDESEIIVMGELVKLFCMVVNGDVQPLDKYLTSQL